MIKLAAKLTILTYTNVMDYLQNLILYNFTFKHSEGITVSILASLKLNLSEETMDCPLNY